MWRGNAAQLSSSDLTTDFSDDRGSFGCAQANTRSG